MRLQLSKSFGLKLETLVHALKARDSAVRWMHYYTGGPSKRHEKASTNDDRDSTLQCEIKESSIVQG